MTVTSKYTLTVQSTETLDLSMDLVTDPSVNHQISGTTGSLGAGTTVPATQAWSDERSLTAGADTVDLAALVHHYATSLDLSALKLQLIQIKADASNTAAVVITQGAANPYLLFGATGDQVSLLPGCHVTLFQNDALADIAAGAKEIDVASTDLDAKYQVHLVAG